ncbi:hypothetical protein HMPREF9318_01683 [Streptococcus urinalis FB127-CNA-2]|uniref:PF06279 family protein n=1 Tax=Streptococcus urinalis 2285-97 TaxID=764291 RepID=G5KEU0_9STRE|nr:DUF1033 family protein [Streptococcus urinalis]EHJ56266.1 hypothetical protein STRUR_2149 [Streptococcus urinalis 2285-97]EKS18184.1 hypothetical protein HMPREF9318_01683 [Streptococcus urinalis FB127-CNA-2]VEF32991.1 DNA-binding protein [Streptococcus urinalis]
MYQVIKLYGDWEPWWFIEGWEDDIIEKLEFDSFELAFDSFENEWESLKQKYLNFYSREDLLATFWNQKEQRWCEECDEYLQQYHSILLLKDNNIIDKELYQVKYKQFNNKATSPSSCAIK